MLTNSFIRPFSKLALFEKICNFRILSLLFIFLVSTQRILCSEESQNLHDQLLVSHKLFTTAHWGALIIDRQTNDVIFSHQPEKLFIPASLVKLFTSSIALETLGPKYTIKTVLWAKAKPDENGILHSDLFLAGGGDPSLSSKDLKRLAEEMHKKGVKCIVGKLICDDTFFSGPILGVHCEWEDLLTEDVPEHSSLSVNGNVVKVIVYPNPMGTGPAEVRIEQEIPFCRLLNRVETKQNLNHAAIEISRGFSDNIIELSGSIPSKGAPATFFISLHDIKEYARRLFVKYLRELDIEVQETPLPHQQNQKIEIASVESKPLEQLIQKMNQDSDNLIADLLFKRLKKYHSQALGKLMEKLEIKPKEFQIYDGSGMSRHNLLSPQQVMRLLIYMDSSSLFNTFKSSLAIAGSAGTLTRRLAKLPQGVTVIGKTGSMSGLSNLAGFITMPNGRQLVFVIMINCSLYSHQETSEALDQLLYKVIDAVLAHH